MILRLSALLLMIPGAALACACCAERGERFEYEVALGDYERGELARVRADGPAILYQTSCGLECVRGIARPKDSYDVTLSVSKDAVVFTMPGHGDLRFDLPASFAYFGTDTNPTGDAGNVPFYTELRFLGAVTGSGDFEGSAPAELVISGAGNICIGAGGFDHWRLRVAGEGVDYRLFGALTPR